MWYCQLLLRAVLANILSPSSRRPVRLFRANNCRSLISNGRGSGVFRCSIGPWNCLTSACRTKNITLMKILVKWLYLSSKLKYAMCHLSNVTLFVKINCLKQINIQRKKKYILLELFSAIQIRHSGEEMWNISLLLK